MSISLTNRPAESITHSPTVTATTSLVESAGVNNLRLRAKIYIGGESEPVAILEQPKGLDDWDFTDILSSLTGRCNHAAGGSDIHVQPDPGSQLISSWNNAGFDTFTTSGKQIVSAIVSGTGGACFSNDIGDIDVGDVFVVMIEHDYSDTGISEMSLVLTNQGMGATYDKVELAGLSGGKLQANHIYFLMALTSNSLPAIGFESDFSSNFNGTFSAYKIQDFKNNPGVYFRIRFDEVYENAAGVTTLGSGAYLDTMLFVPVKLRAGESFSDYLDHGNTGKFLSRANDGATIFRHGIGMETRMMYVSTSAFLRARLVVDAGSNSENDIPNMGWGIILANSEGGFTYNPAETDETLTFQLYSIDEGGGIFFTVALLTIDCELTCYPKAKALSFVGDLGEETILFRGLESKAGISDKSFRKDRNRVDKVLRAFKKFEHILRTLYETEATRLLLHELTYTEKPVWMSSITAPTEPTEVTVITDEIELSEQDELIENEIELQYYE